MDNTNKIYQRIQAKREAFEKAIAELNEALIQLKDELGATTAEIEQAIEMIKYSATECFLLEELEQAVKQIQLYNIDIDIRDCYPTPVRRTSYPPYRERMKPKQYSKRIYWYRIRSNPQRRRKSY